MKMNPKISRNTLLFNLMKCLNLAIKLNETDVPSNEIKNITSKNRREFLSNSGKLAAGIGIASMLDGCKKTIDLIKPYKLDGINSEVNPGNKTPRIAIIGAGIAGLHAAFILKQKGFKATIYEASSRMGGRIFTCRNILGNGLYTELGGEFIDSIHKDMLTLAKTFNLELIDTKSSNTSNLQNQAYFINNIHYTEQQVIDAFVPYAQKIKSDQLNMSGVITVDNFSAFDQSLDQMSIAQYFDKIGLNGWLRNLLEVAYITEFGQPIDSQTALNFLWMISPRVTNGSFEIFGASDERYKIKGGNDLIINNLAAQLNGQILLGNELIAINQTKGGSYDLSFVVDKTTKNVSADFVLLTIPFTILKNVAVSPAWPSWKLKAISELGYGNNSKLMIGFKKRYWNDLGYAGYYFANNLLQSGWDNSEKQDSIEGGLTIFSGGQQSIDVENRTTLNQAAIHLEYIEKMYPGASNYKNGKSERFVWPTYKWSKCSYACFKPGQYTSIAGNEIKPVDKIFFAGEHCSYDFQGYMNGGAETGRKAAEAIANKIKFG